MKVLFILFLPYSSYIKQCILTCHLCILDDRLAAAPSSRAGAPALHAPAPAAPAVLERAALRRAQRDDLGASRDCRTGARSHGVADARRAGNILPATGRGRASRVLICSHQGDVCGGAGDMLVTEPAMGTPGAARGTRRYAARSVPYAGAAYLAGLRYRACHRT